jgi:hypothetical protein
MSEAQTSTAVVWCAVTDEGHDWHTLQAVPTSNTGFFERRSYFFKHQSPGWSLFIDDEPLPLVSNSLDCWQWQPRFFAGEVTAELQRSDGSTASLFLLDIAPDPGKVGREFFDAMIDELWAEDPTLVLGAEPATTITGEFGTLEDPWIAFVRLRRYIPEFFRALAPIRQAPRRTLRMRRESAPLHHVRRADSRTAISLLRSAAVSMFISNPNDAPSVSPDTRVDVPSIEDTVDSAANRAMLALLRSLYRRAQTVLSRLQAEVDKEVASDTRTPLASRWPVRRKFLENALMQLALVVRRPPFSDVRRAEVTAAGLTAIAADPLYARAWSRGWRALRNGVETEFLSERLWTSPSWEIYERWCFLRVGKLLRLAKPSWKWSLSRDPRRWTGFGSDGQAELRLQPTFNAQRERTEGRWSISKQRIPDLLLTVRHGAATRFLLLDAKYRTSRDAVLDAMESAHIYQDSLRIGSMRPDATLLLVPAIRETDWLANPNFVEEHRVGIFPLSPAQSTPLPPAISAIL